MKRTSNMIWGIILVVAGMVLAMNAFGITDINIFFDGWWTLFIIVPCGMGLVSDRDKVGNLIGLCVGVILFLCCRDIFRFDLVWKLMLPLIIMAVGAKMILGSVWQRDSEGEWKLLDTSANKEGAAVFSGATMDYSGEVFQGTKLDAVFGGMKCDLRNAIIERDCVIDASAIFGGIDIYVPDSLNVKVNSRSIFGGISYKDHINNPANIHTLYLNGICMFGGIEIK